MSNIFMPRGTRKVTRSVRVEVDLYERAAKLAEKHPGGPEDVTKAINKLIRGAVIKCEESGWVHFYHEMEAGEKRSPRPRGKMLMREEPNPVNAVEKE
jgi:hypothetical protein